MTVHFCSASYSWHIWTLEVSIFLYYFPCLLSCVLHFFVLLCCAILKTTSAPTNYVNFQPHCSMQFLNFLSCIIVCYTDRVYGALASHFCIIALNNFVQRMTLGTQYILAITCNIQKCSKSPSELNSTDYLCHIPNIVAYSLLHRAATAYQRHCAQHCIGHNIMNVLLPQYCLLQRLYPMTSQGHGTQVVP